MAENKEGTEKTEQPSSKRLEQARGKGQVASTKELAPVFVLLGGVGMLTLYAPTVWRQVQQQSWVWFERAGTVSLTTENAHSLLIEMTEGVLVLLVPFALILTALGVSAYLLQTGLIWKEDAFKPDFSKLNPLNGLKRIFSLRGGVELLKSLLKVGLIGVIVYAVMNHDVQEVIQLPMLALGEALSTTWNIAIRIIIWVGMTLLVLALADLMYQRWQFMRDMRMTKQEVKDESRDIEGDPLVRSRRASLQRERVRQRMMQAVPKADVVITNPTHLAVALRYEAGKMEAPSVIAKGAEVLAEKIKQIARNAGVPIIENRTLAQSLYRTVKVGQEIPADLYRAAAEMLAYVYRLQGETRT